MTIHLDGNGLDPKDLACGYFCPTAAYNFQLMHPELSECPASQATYNAYGCGKCSNEISPNIQSKIYHALGRYTFVLTLEKKPW